MSKNNQKEVRKRNYRIRNFDYGLLFMAILLVAFGLVMIYSSSAYNASAQFGDATHYLKRQLISAIIGFGFIVAILIFGYHFFVNTSTLSYSAATFLCLIVNFIGEKYNGQRRWFSIGGLSVQPSEIGKVTLILMMACLIAKMYPRMGDFKTSLKVLAFGVPVTLFVAINNLSTGIILAAITFVMCLVAVPGWKKYMMMLGGVFLLGVIYLALGSGYRSERVAIWLHPEEADEGYQVLQGLYAIGSGGMMGKGLGESIQKISTLPEAENDMIFSIICEELGVLGALCVIILYVVLLWRIFDNAMKAKDIEGSFICIGVMVHIGLQAILNIAVATNSIPNTGVALPFISYGGTAIMFTLAEIGLVLSVSRGIKIDV